MRDRIRELFEDVSEWWPLPAVTALLAVAEPACGQLVWVPVCWGAGRLLASRMSD